MEAFFPIFSDVIWAGLVLEDRMISPYVITAGLIAELFFFKAAFPRLSWLKTVFVTFTANLFSTCLGLVITPLGTLALEIIFSYAGLSFGGFLTVVFCIYVNTVVEIGVAKFMLWGMRENSRLGLRQWAMIAIANAVTVSMALAAAYFYPKTY